MVEITKLGISISDKAAAKLKAILEREKKGSEFGLRIGVQGGGCSGMSYQLDLDAKREDDKVYAHEETGVQVFVDPRSHLYVNGSVLDYKDSLMESGFDVKNPNVTGSCGCGQSFQV